jgi:hypothetical protein
MIYGFGTHAPTSAQVAEAKEFADDSFCNLSSDQFVKNLPSWGKREHDDRPILLKLRNVEPHDDTWVGGYDEPVLPNRRAVFWLLKGELIIHAALEYRRMKAGDFVVFNDGLVHSVLAKRQWLGAAWQLKAAAGEALQTNQPYARPIVAWNAVAPDS